MGKVTQKEAIQTLINFYGVKIEGGRVAALSSILPDKTPDAVWEAWTILAARTQAIESKKCPIPKPSPSLVKVNSAES